ncbi:MAG: DUF1287 domain-containing protein [Pseudomonadota bacterium]
MSSRRTILVGLAASAFTAQPAAAPAFARRSLAWDIRLVDAARSQIGVTVGYDPAYRALDYPGGDVAPTTGVCTDVIIRAYRSALGFDLQVAINEDMVSDFSAYPDRWGLSRTDRNIDHRRVPNLETYFKREGAERAADGWTAGDLFTGRLGRAKLPHIAIVSDRRTHGESRPLLIHNIGRGTEESDAWSLFSDWRRFRFNPGLDAG